MADEMNNVEMVEEKAKKPKSPMTYKEFLQAVITDTAIVNGMTIKAKATELLEKEMAKSSRVDENGVKKPSKAKQESASQQAEILDFLRTKAESVACKEIAEAVGMTSPKVNSCLRFLVEDGKVQKLDFGRNKPFGYMAI